MIKEQDIVLVACAQAHGNSSVIERGKVVAVNGDIASVILAGEMHPREYNVDELESSEEHMGFESEFFGNQVIDGIRR